MSDTKWTKGNWRYSGRLVYALTGEYTVPPNVNKWSCFVQANNGGLGASTEELEAVACLMHTAPRLYQELEKLTSVAMRFGIPTDRAEAALAAARGETDAT